MKTSSNGNIFRVTGPLCGEFTGHRPIPRKGQWRWASRGNREAGDLRRHRAHYDVTVMMYMYEQDVLYSETCL